MQRRARTKTSSHVRRLDTAFVEEVRIDYEALADALLSKEPELSRLAPQRTTRSARGRRATVTTLRVTRVRA